MRTRNYNGSRDLDGEGVQQGLGWHVALPNALVELHKSYLKSVFGIKTSVLRLCSSLASVGGASEWSEPYGERWRHKWNRAIRGGCAAGFRFGGPPEIG